MVHAAEPMPPKENGFTMPMVYCLACKKRVRGTFKKHQQTCRYYKLRERFMKVSERNEEES
jgi:hypothetical protein